MPAALFLPLLMIVEFVCVAFFCVAAFWVLRRWLRCRLWQPARVAQELLFVLFLLSFGGQIFYLTLEITQGGCPLYFEEGADTAHKVKLLLLLLLGQGSALLCFVWLGVALLLVACYAFRTAQMERWCPFGQMARRVAAVTLGLLPLAGVAILYDHAARMHWKFDAYGGSPGTSVGWFTVALFAVYVIASLCITCTAAKVYADRLLCRLAFLPVLVFLLLLLGFVGGVFHPVG